MLHTLIVAARVVNKNLSGWILHFSSQKKDKTCHCYGEKHKAEQSAVLPILNKAIGKDRTEKSDIFPSPGSVSQTDI